MGEDTGRRRIVVGYEDSASGQAALDWALEQGDRLDLPVHAVIVSPLVYQPVPLGGLVSAVIDDLEGVAEQAKSRAAQVAPHVPFSARVGLGHAVAALVEESSDAELLVVGRGVHTTSGELVGGSTSAAVIAHAHCPVIVVEPSQMSRRPGDVVVGVDGSPESELALRFAFETAARRGTTVTAVRAWHLQVPEILSLPWLDPQTVHTIEIVERAALAEAVAPWARKFPDVAVRQVVSKAEPVDAIVARARQGDLIVVGSRGRGGFTGLLLGSVSQSLLHRKRPCPLVVVHGDRSATSGG